MSKGENKFGVAQHMYDSLLVNTHFGSYEDDIVSVEELNGIELLVKTWDSKRCIYNTNLRTLRFLPNNKVLTDDQLINIFYITLYTKMETYGITQEELAEELGVSQKTISNYRNGTTIPNLLILYRMSVIFNCTIDDLIFH